MRRVLVAISVLLLGCGDKVVEPVDPIVGEWVLSEVKSDALEAILGDVDFATLFFGNIRGVEFRADETWQDNLGDSGTYTTTNTKLTMTHSSGSSVAWTFAVSGSELTLTITGADLIANLQNNGSPSEEVRGVQQMLSNSLDKALIVAVFARQGS